MKRRSFLKLFGQSAVAVAAAPVLAKIPEKQSRPWNYYEDGPQSAFGLAQPKPEGRTVVYDTGTPCSDDELNARLSALAESMRETKEKVAADVYTRAFLEEKV